ncbi:FTR1 family iron permease [Chitinimonas koreensis]|uniref:FTR1 family iron permease n=1 Tax=Chitinimonas koreensis TaxID=356302 RepID=UPI000419B540|nr:FTR1 family protein [Chitinimonas koreensis]QNM97868.1 FTR1 family protein [Chitinimonas koreensis]
MLGEVLFIVWRESVEALLIVGILHAWLRNHPEAAQGRRYLWAGVGAGLLAAVALGGAILGFAEWFEGEQQDCFQLAMMAAAAALIVQMVFWMRRHGRTLKRELESGMAERARQSNWWGMLALVALAVAREGSETVIFLWGLGSAQQGVDLARFAVSALAGFALALATFWLLQLGGRLFSWRAFFRFSEFMLLLLAGALLIGSVERMISFGWLPGLLDPAWDSRALLDDGGPVGGLVAALTGYRARPALTMVLALAGYWALLPWALRRAERPAAAAVALV